MHLYLRMQFTMNPFFSKRKTKTMSQNLNHYHNYYRFLFETGLSAQQSAISMMCDKFYLLTATGMLKGIKTETAEDILQLLWPMKSAFPDAVRLFQLVLTLPVSSAQAERSFSSMKRVKNYLRWTVSQQRLTNLCLSSIERELCDTVLCWWINLLRWKITN